jgi:hypothetical protein
LFSLLSLSAAAIISRISSVLFVKGSRVICSFHLRDFKRFSFPYECSFTCTYYEALCVSVMRNALFYGVQTDVKYVLLFWAFIKRQHLPENTVVFNVKLYDLVEIV